MDEKAKRLKPMVEVYGIGNASPIHICGGHCSAITTPIALPMAAPSEAEPE